MAHVRGFPFKRSNDNTATGGNTGYSQLRRHHGFPITGPCETNARVGGIPTNGDVVCRHHSAILYADKSKVCTTHDRSLMNTAAPAGSCRQTVPNVFALPVNRLIHVFALTLIAL